jgi:transcriptional regulator with XRE-family HTH domain
MLLIGNQLRAARALAEVEQQELADAASVHVNTIRKMEAKGRSEITSAADVLRRVQTALERFGVEFTNSDSPGVRLRDYPSALPVAGGSKTSARKKTAAKPSRKKKGSVRLVERGLAAETDTSPKRSRGK